MMDKRDFEKLVFEKAEKIKARDRRNKIIRISVIPAAAAFAVISLVGVRSLFYMPNSMGASFSDAAATAGYSDKNTVQSMTAASADDNENNEEYTNEYEDYGAVDSGADYDTAQETQPTGELPAVTAPSSNSTPAVTFDTNTRIVISDDNAAVIAAALDREFTSDEFPDKGFLGTVTVGDTSYNIYETHVKAAKNGEVIGQFPLDDDTKQTIENILPIRFDSLR